MSGGGGAGAVPVEQRGEPCARRAMAAGDYRSGHLPLARPEGGGDGDPRGLEPAEAVRLLRHHDTSTSPVTLAGWQRRGRRCAGGRWRRAAGVRAAAADVVSGEPPPSNRKSRAWVGRVCALQSTCSGMVRSGGVSEVATAQGFTVAGERSRENVVRSADCEVRLSEKADNGQALGIVRQGSNAGPSGRKAAQCVNYGTDWGFTVACSFSSEAASVRGITIADNALLL